MNEFELQFDKVIEIKMIVKNMTGLSKIDNKLFIDIINERMNSLHIPDYLNYKNYMLFSGTNEVQNVIEKIANGETYFNRDSSQFVILRNKIIPELINMKKNEDSHNVKIRILCCGCSTGEEPYTIAIFINELNKIYNNVNYEILGIDINLKSLETARAGIYNKRSLRNLPEEYVNAYFKINGENYHLKEELKNMVHFKRLNLVEDPFPFYEYGDWDIILCRNIFIYFEELITKKVLKNLFLLLEKHGYLFTDRTASTFLVIPGFEPVFYEDTFVYRKRIIDEKAYKPKSSLRESEIQVNKKSEKSEKDNSKDLKQPLVDNKSKDKTQEDEKGKSTFYIVYNKIVEKVLHEDFQTAKENAIRLKNEFPNRIEVDILLAKIYFEMNEIEESKKICDEFTRKMSIIPEFHYISGDISLIKNNEDKAIEGFKKTLFLDPNFGMAYIKLGEIYLNQNQKERAINEFTNAVNIFKSTEQKKYNIFMGSITNDSIIKLCNVKIKLLSEEI